MRMLQAAVLAMGAAAAPSLSEAQVVEAARPSSVLDAVRAHGHKARLETDEAGIPVVIARMGDLNYTVHFYGCDAPGGCTQLQFASSFDLEPGLTPEFVNQWNEDWVVGRLSVNADGDPLYTLFVSTAGEGLPAGTFAAVMETWSSTLLGVVDDIGY